MTKNLRCSLLCIDLPVQEYLQPKNRQISGMCVQRFRLRCSASCVCGSISKPCKNNKEVVINQCQPPPSSAFERHQIALEKERESVQVNFVSCAMGHGLL